MEDPTRAHQAVITGESLEPAESVGWAEVHVDHPIETVGIEADSLLGTAEIAKRFKLAREYVTDHLVKDPRFPLPDIDMSNKRRMWSASKVEQFFAQRALERAAERDVRKEERRERVRQAAMSAGKGRR